MKLFNRKTRIIEKTYEDGTTAYFCQREKVFSKGWKNIKYHEWPYVISRFNSYGEAKRHLVGNIATKTVVKERTIFENN